MNKTTWVAILVTAEACTTEKTQWTVEEIQNKTSVNLSDKTIRTALGHLEDMGFVYHQPNSTIYEFKQPSF
jgi:DNA-binding GntR family transcriptional regulator